MTTRIRKIGNSSGIIISKRMLEELNIEPKDELELTVKDGKILIQKIDEPRKDWKEKLLKAGSMQEKGDLTDLNI